MAWLCIMVIVGRLLELISGEAVPIELKIESVVILGSLAKGPEHVVQSVFDSGIVPMLLKGDNAVLLPVSNVMRMLYFLCNGLQFD